MWVAIAGLTVVQFCLYPIGVYAHLLLDGVADTDLIVPTLVNDPSVFPLWAGDFLFVAIVAAAMSSMDSVLLVAASTGFRNLFLPFMGPQAMAASHQLGWTRFLVIFLAGLSAFFALDPPGDILQITIFSGSLYAACFLPAVVLGLYWSKGSAQGVLVSMAAGVVTLLVWLAQGYNSVLHEVFPALAVSLIAYVSVAVWDGRKVDLASLLADPRQTEA
jgi:Na+/pantothenate symporter